MRSAPNADPGRPVVLSARTGEDEQAVAGYWTPARMMAAKPARPLLEETAKDRPRAKRTSGAAVNIPATEPKRAGGAGSGVRPTKAVAVPKPYSDYPDKLNGKVFFTDSQGDDYECSGTAVNSENKSLVWTAGHCVHDGDGGKFYRQWVFVPAYSSGKAPYGRWTASELFTTGGWADDGDFREDFGAAIVRPLNGERLADRIGGHGMLFNAPRNQKWTVFGYPASGRFSGKSQYRCVAGRLGDDDPETGNSGPLTIKISCDMTVGASGGGWIVGISNGFGKINSVTSYERTEVKGATYGPYQGADALELYNQARKRQP